MSEITQNPTPVTPAAAPAEQKVEKAPKIQMPHQNGVTRPKDGTATGRVWAIADELSNALGKPVPRKAVMEKGQAEGINPATIATQYGKWRRFHGLKREEKPAPVAAAPAQGSAPTAPASDTTVTPAKS